MREEKKGAGRDGRRGGREGGRVGRCLFVYPISNLFFLLHLSSGYYTGRYRAIQEMKKQQQQQQQQEQQPSWHASH